MEQVVRQNIKHSLNNILGKDINHLVAGLNTFAKKFDIGVTVSTGLDDNGSECCIITVADDGHRAAIHFLSVKERLLAKVIVGNKEDIQSTDYFDLVMALSLESLFAEDDSAADKYQEVIEHYVDILNERHPTFIDQTLH